MARVVNKGSSALISVRTGHKLIHVFDRELAERILFEDATPKIPEQAHFADNAAMTIRSLVATCTGLPCKNYKDAMFHLRKLGAESHVLKPCLAIGAATDFKRHSSPAEVERVVAEVQSFLLKQNVKGSEDTVKKHEDVDDKKSVKQSEDKVVRHTVKRNEDTLDEHIETGTQTQTTSSEAGCTANESTIFKETESTRPEASFRIEWQHRIDEHKKRYPGGTLPNELYSFDTYFRNKKKSLSADQLLMLRCCYCGSVVS